MRRAADIGEQHISLAVAAARAYHDIMGEPLAPAATVTDWNATLNAVAKVLSRACAIYSTTTSGRLVRMSMMVLSNGEFGSGGAILRAEDGTLYGGLTVGRRDLDNAVSTLRQIGVTFETPSQ